MNEHAEGTPEKVGMRQGLKLARLACLPFAKATIWFPSFARHAGEELVLRSEELRAQPGQLASGADGVVVYVRSDVLLAGLRQHIGHNVVTPIRTERPVRALRLEEFLGR